MGVPAFRNIWSWYGTGDYGHLAVDHAPNAVETIPVDAKISQ